MEEYYGKRINKLRTEKGLSKAQLAKEIGVSEITITNWENQTSKIKALTLVKLAVFFKVSADYILGLRD